MHAPHGEALPAGVNLDGAHLSRWQRPSAGTASRIHPLRMPRSDFRTPGGSRRGQGRRQGNEWVSWCEKGCKQVKMNARVLPHSDHTVLQKRVPFAAATQAGMPDAPSRLSARPYASYPSAPVPAGVPKDAGHALPSCADSRWRPVSCTVPVIWCGKGKTRRFR